jgi:hypothetical protein
VKFTTKMRTRCFLWLALGFVAPLLLISGCGQRREVGTTFLCRIEAERLIAGGLVASPDRRHVMYAAADRGRQWVAADGKPEAQYDGILQGTLCFSSDGKHHAYGAGRAKLRFIVLDGRAQAPCDGIREGTPVFSPDGQRLAYGALKGEFWSMVVDGRGQWSFDELWPPVFSADSRHCAYVARTGPKQYAILDTALQRPCDNIDARSLAFDGNGRLVYLAFDQGKAIGVRDGAVLPPDSVIPAPRAYSKASARQPGTAAKWSVVCDNIAGPAYDQVGNPALAAAGTRFGYIARQDSQWFAVIDGRRGGAHPLIYPNSLAFGPDGSHYAFASLAGNKQYVVLDDRPGRGFGAIIAGDQPVVFDSPKALHYLALSHDSVFVVEEQIR